ALQFSAPACGRGGKKRGARAVASDEEISMQGANMTLSPDNAHRPIVSDINLALIVYILYCVGYFTGVTALIGVIIAHVKVDEADPVLRSHYQFQIRTFWIGLL